MTSVCLSHDSKYIISGGLDKTIKIWNFESGILIKSLTGHDDVVDQVCISKDSKFIVSGSDDITVKVWDLSMIGSLKFMHKTY